MESWHLFPCYAWNILCFCFWQFEYLRVCWVLLYSVERDWLAFICGLNRKNLHWRLLSILSLYEGCRHGIFWCVMEPLSSWKLWLYWESKDERMMCVG